MAVYKSKSFARFQKKAGLTDADLWKAVQSAESGLIDADLGGGMIKQRIARAGEGKSGGARSIICFKRGSRAIYVYGFEKKSQSNIKGNELEAFQELAKIVLGYSEDEMAKQVRAGSLFAINPKGGNSDAEKI